MSNVVARTLLRLGWSLPLARLLAQQRPVIVLYHGVSVADPEALSSVAFEQHVLFLKRHFEMVAPSELGHRRKRTDRIQVLLTFDDGLRNNAEVVAPILRRHGVPGLFFVSSRHATAGKYLWFSYLRALEQSFPATGFYFRGTFFDMSVDERQRSVRGLWDHLLTLLPHPAAMYQAIDDELPSVDDFVTPTERADRYAGMTADQVAALAADPLFSIGAHTIDHPFLTRCHPTEAVRQMRDNRGWLEAVCGRRCDTIAFPGGDYNAEVLALCPQLGFSRGYAVSPRIDRQSPLELSRLGIYSDSTDILGFKVQWANVLRRMRIPVG